MRTFTPFCEISLNFLRALFVCGVPNEIFLSCLMPLPCCINWRNTHLCFCQSKTGGRGEDSKRNDDVFVKMV